MSEIKMVYYRTCPGCGEKFETSDPTRKFCLINKTPHRPCYWRWRKRTGRDLHTRTCVECNVEFKTYISKKVYCTPECYRKAAEKRRLTPTGVSVRNRDIIADMLERAGANR